MFSNKTRVLLAFLLALILTFSFSMFAAAQEESDVSPDASEVSEEISEESAEESAEESPDESIEEESVEDEQSEDEEQIKPWMGITIIGGIILVVTLIIFIMILRKTPLGLKIAKFFKDFKSELKKIVWLSRKETVKQTGIVLMTVLIAAVFLGLLDYAFTQLIQLIG